MIGSMLGPYRVLEKLGEGGMGEVYKARDTRLDRSVAIKILPPERVADVGRRLRFAQEARAASALNHPNIVTIHDIGSADDVQFIAMEYVEGQTLDRLIGKKGLPPRQAVGYAVQIADALAKAHGAGIVHRDIKPSNIMVTPDGLVKILDFGLAKLVERTPESEDEATRTVGAITEVGQVVGTIAYMSPEQATGVRLDARSDIFSFGAVLYEMLTGRRPFAGETGPSTLEAILAKEPTPPSGVIAGLPFELERAVLRCLRKDPQRRWQTMADLKVALQDVKEELDSGKVSQVVSVATVAARRPRRWWIAIAGAALLFVASGVAWQLLRPAPQPAAGFALERLTTEGSAVLPPAISADGNLIAYASERNGRYSLNVRQMRAREAIRLPQHEGNDWFPCFSPDGRQVVYRSERDGGGLYMIDTLGGALGGERKVADRGHYPSFSPDGGTIAYIVPTGMAYEAPMFLVSAQGGGPRRFQAGFVAMATETFYQPLLWSADGRELLFSGGRPGKRRGWWIAPAVGGEPAAIQNMPPLAFANARFVVAWRSGYLYYVDGEPIGGSTLYRARLSDGPWRITGSPEKVASPAGLQLGGWTSTSGRMVFTSITPVVNVWSASLTGGVSTAPRLERVTTDLLWKRHLTVSADGTKLAYVTYTHPAQRNVEVRIRDLAMGQESLIVGAGIWPLLDPTLSRDGSRVVYTDVVDDKLVSYIADTSSSSGRVVCQDCRARGFFNDPAAVLVQAHDHLERQPLDGGAAKEVADVPLLRDVGLSPDGSRLAFTRARTDGPGALHVADISRGPATSTAWKLVAEDPNFIGVPAWSTDGKSLYYVSQRDGFPCVWRQVIAADGEPEGKAVAVLHLHPGSGIFTAYNNIAVAADRIFVLVTEVRGDIWLVTLDR